MEKNPVLLRRLFGIGWLGLWVWGCSPPPTAVTTPIPAALPAPTHLTPAPQPTLQVAVQPFPSVRASPRPQPPRPARRDQPATQVKKPIVAKTLQPSLPLPPAIPSRGHLPASHPRPGLVDAPAKAASPAQTPGDQGPVEIELVPPEDASILAPPPPPQDPQAVLRTPLAVHFGYSYSYSLNNLVRDGVLQIQLLNRGYTNLDISMVNRGLRPLHFFFFPGMIFKPEATTTYASLMMADLHEIFLYPGSRENLRIQGYSLDHRKPLPDERFPVRYRLEPDRDPRYPKALLVMRALLTEDAAEPDRSEDYSKNRTTIVQMALWQAAAGRYNPDSELANLLGPIDPKEFQSVRKLVYAEAEKLQRKANQF